MWKPLIEEVLRSVEGRFSETSLALGRGVNSFVSLSDNSQENTECFLQEFVSRYPKLHNIKDEIHSEWQLCRLSILSGDQDEEDHSEKVEGDVSAILLFMHHRGNGGGNASSRPLKDLYPNFYAALVVAATIAFTSATNERSFSKLKIIKNRLRSTMLDERLSALMLMHCERDIVDTLDNGDLVTLFAGGGGAVNRRIVL
jgi:hypothetical protein